MNNDNPSTNTTTNTTTTTAPPNNNAIPVEETTNIRITTRNDNLDDSKSSHATSFENTHTMNHNHNSNDDDEIISPLLSSTSNNNNSSSSSSSSSSSTNTNININMSFFHNISKCITRTANTFNIQIQNIMDIYSDQSGSCQNLTKGLSLIILLGSFLGIIMPKDNDLPSPFYKYISSIIGYTYFVSWSYSFFPQIITNYQKKATTGLSTDASILAVLNYTCYTIYNAFFFWDGTIRKEYKDRHGEQAEITVVSNDVAFAIDALVLTIVILGQIYIYGGYTFKHNVSKSCWVIVGVTVGICGIQSMCILWKVPGFFWIDFLYTMATVKLILTIMTYIPQILLNYKRKSTDGKLFINRWKRCTRCTR
jgi:uncharacterized protein with PQ loop repeat